MKQLCTCMTAVMLVSIPAFSGVNAVNSEVQKEKTKMLTMERLGGLVEKPGAADGCVAFINAQKLVAVTEIKEPVGQLARLLRAKVDIVEGPTGVTLKTAAEELKKVPKAKAGVFLVDCKDCNNAILVVPESRFAFVNVAALAGEGISNAFVAARARKEMVRAFLMLCGACDSGYADTLMGPVSKVDDLDKFVNFAPPMDVVGRARNYLPKIGVGIRTVVPYYNACKQGWAPAPTNDAQKVIWDKVHAIPQKPIKIEFDPKTDTK